MDKVDESQTQMSTSKPLQSEQEMMKLDAATLKERKRAHPTGIQCEGCGHFIDFVQDYDNVICYRVPIVERQLFYFHDSFCVVTLIALISFFSVFL